jgi:hypothetical protein
MNDVSDLHPTPQVLTAFSLGQLTGAEATAVEGHLTVCDACRTTVDHAPPDSFVSLLRGATEQSAEPPTTPEDDGLARPQMDTPTRSLTPAPGLVPQALVDHPRYRIQELLGVGGMGAVYRAEHQLMERTVALKVINRSLTDNPATVERFRREVKAAARLAHPNIVTAHDADQAGDTHFLVMEYVEGINLARLVAEHGRLPVAQACEYIRQAALGLQHAFEQGMVHRDIKPQNLMRTPRGQIKILDFGLARFAMETTPAGALLTADPAPPVPGASLTQDGMVVGTPDYIAPEQARDAHTADIRADIYSLGCTLYDLLAGHAPFPEGTAVQKVMAHLQQTPRTLTELRDDVPAELVRVVERMMAKAPTQRYQTPAKVVEALTPFLPGTPASRRGSRRLLAVAVAVCALAPLAGAVIYVWTSKPFSFERGGRESVPGEPLATEPGSVVAAPEKLGKMRHPARGEGVPAKYRESINKGLAYLAKMQLNDGHWEASGGQYPFAITALAGMAMLMEGSTLSDGKYADSIRKAVDWLMEHSQPNGLLVNPNHPSEAGRYLFGHGYVMLFLATVYGQEEDGDRRHKLEQILTKAVEFTGNAQSNRGGWGYITAAEGNNFDEGASTIIQLQGLRAARNAGIVVPKKLIDIDYLRKCTTPRGGIIYSITNATDGDRPALTAAALACMFTAGEYDSDLAKKWIKFCQQTIPIDKPDLRIGHDEYAHYYYAQSLYIIGDKGYEKLFPGSKPAEQLTWSKYRETMFDGILSRQAGDGGWDTGPIGPAYSTACCLTILQLDNGTLQIYQR